MVFGIYNLCKKINFLLCFMSIIVGEYLLYKINGKYEDMIESIIDRLAKLNILYVKVFQSLALDNNLIDEDMNNKLLEYTDNVPWDYGDISYIDLINVSNKKGLNLNSKNNKPISSGMISLVFKLERVENPETSVIIKMKRKNIEKRLNAGIEELLFLVYMLSYIPVVNRLHIYELVEKNIVSIREQTDFIKEIENMELIRENSKNLKYVVIPKVYREVTEDNSNLIMMEYIDGEKITELKEEEYKEYAKLVVKFGLVSYIMNGVTHGDLHSGNILFLKDEKDEKYKKKIGILDFGIIYKYGEKYKYDMFEILSEMYECDRRETAIKSLNLIVEPEGVLERLPEYDYNKIVNISLELLNESLENSKNANQYQIFKFISLLKEYLSKRELLELGIHMKDDFIKTQMFMAMSHGVTLKLCKQENVLELFDECLNEIFNKKLLLEIDEEDEE